MKRNVAAWLDSGHQNRMTKWMKIAFWKPGDDLITTLLKCYDYLPDLEPPAYPC